MTSLKFNVKDPMGFHARPCSVIVGQAGKFKSNLRLVYKEKEVDLKSILIVMALAVKFNDEVIIKAEGPDEIEAIAALEAALKANKLM